MRWVGVLLVVLNAAFARPVLATDPDTLEVTLPTVTVEASRSAETDASAPFAVTIHDRDLHRIATESATSLQDVLATVPGILVNDRGHFALGERIVVRGAGWRSAFGVRGVMVVQDGVPLTMPDGQAFADVIEPSLIRSAEVIRGPASVFWGNAAGGVLYVRTRPEGDTPTLRLRGMLGGYGERHVLAEANLPVGRARVSAFASHIGRDGYRAHSDGSFQRGGLHVHVPVGDRTVLSASAAGALQDARNPGGLTAEQLQADPTQVDAQYVTFGSGKESVQVQSILTVDHALSVGTLSASVWGVRRDLDNPLPFRYVAVDRLAGGARLRLSGPLTQGFQFTVGGDYGLQRDDRLNFANQGGEPAGDATLDQVEDVTNLAGYAYISSTPAPRLEASAGVRFDAIRFEMEDRLLENGDESGSRAFRAVSPTVGVGYRLGAALLFANVSTAFETPTTTELVNRPDATGGFNPNLEPEYTRGIEAGIRGSLPGSRLTYEAAVYHATVKNILVQSETEDRRAYYRNAGNTRHTGFEFRGAWVPAAPILLQATYTYNRLRFTSDALEGNALPGVAPHRAYVDVRLTLGKVELSAVADASTGFYADEQNAFESDGYVLVHLRAAHRGLGRRGIQVRPFFELENALDARYNASVVVNAFGGRFYEPGFARLLRGGLNVSF